jgi:hypothetical protein
MKEPRAHKPNVPAKQHQRHRTAAEKEAALRVAGAEAEFLRTVSDRRVAKRPFADVLRQWAVDIRTRKSEKAARELLAALPPEEAAEMVSDVATFLARVYSALSEDAARLHSA